MEINVEKLLAMALYGMVSGMVEAGMPNAEALKYAAFLMIEDQLGRDAIESAPISLGLSTARRWRARSAEALNKLDADSVPDSPTAAVLEQIIRAYSRKG